MPTIVLCLLSSMILLRTNSEAFEENQTINCFVVSGLRAVGSSKEDFAENGPRLIRGSRICVSVNSFEEIERILDQQDKPENILILQETHGSNGAAEMSTAESKNLRVKNSKIISFLKKLAAQHKVYYVSDACYGGNLIEEYLIDPTPTNQAPWAIRKSKGPVRSAHNHKKLKNRGSLIGL